MPQLYYFHNLAFAYCHTNSHSNKPTDQNSSDDRGHSVPPLPPVDAFPLWPAEVIQKASHLQSSSCPPPSVCFSAQVNQASSSRLVGVNTCFTWCSSQTAGGSAFGSDQWHWPSLLERMHMIKSYYYLLYLNFYLMCNVQCSQTWSL